jgi:DNA-directed RNA polymerase subunit RPC12/RpoP
MQDSCSIIRRAVCPVCNSIDLAEAPAWAPLGSGSNIFDSSEWEYECQECHKKFEMPIPKSPSEEKNRKCRYCGMGHIHRLTSVGGLPLYCG